MTPLRGNVRVPGDKSIGHRACLFAALGSGTSTVRGLSGGGDNRSTRSALAALGVTQTRLAPDALAFDGRGLRGLRAPDEPIDCGNSGTTLRLLMGILAGQTGTFVLTGDASLRRRPMRRVATCLQALGANLALPEGDHAPVVVTGGPLRGAAVEGKVASAQVKSAVLLAGLLADGQTRYREPEDTRDHTERMLRALGVPIDRTADGGWVLTPVAALPPRDWQVPGDPSSAAFFCAAAALLPGSEIRLPGVCLNPGRTGFLRVLARMGANVSVEDRESRDGEPIGTLVARSGPLRGVTIDPGEVPACIDELPLLALLAATAEGESRITGAAELRVKECDRIEAIARLLADDGAEVEVLPDGWHLAGGHRPRGGFTAQCRDDHRIALCAAILGRAAPRPILLDAPDAIDVSYPDFLLTLARLGGAPGDLPP
jgi:3-phosphoshikimate 1-carboxyvinyltransferase